MRTRDRGDCVGVRRISPTDDSLAWHTNSANAWHLHQTVDRRHPHNGLSASLDSNG